MRNYTMSDLRGLGIIIPAMREFINSEFARVNNATTIQNEMNDSLKFLSLLNPPTSSQIGFHLLKSVDDKIESEKGLHTEKYFQAVKLSVMILKSINATLQSEALVAFENLERAKELARDFADKNRQREDESFLNSITEQQRAEEQAIEKRMQAELEQKLKDLDNQIRGLVSNLAQIDVAIKAVRQVIGDIRNKHKDIIKQAASECVLSNGKKLLDGVDITRFNVVVDKLLTINEKRILLNAELESNKFSIDNLKEIHTKDGRVPENIQKDIDTFEARNVQIQSEVAELAKVRVDANDELRTVCLIEVDNVQDITILTTLVDSRLAQHAEELQPQAEKLESLKGAQRTTESLLSIAKENRDVLSNIDKPKLDNALPVEPVPEKVFNSDELVRALNVEVNPQSNLQPVVENTKETAILYNFDAKTAKADSLKTLAKDAEVQENALINQEDVAVNQNDVKIDEKISAVVEGDDEFSFGDEPQDQPNAPAINVEPQSPIINSNLAPKNDAPEQQKSEEEAASSRPKLR